MSTVKSEFLYFQTDFLLDMGKVRNKLCIDQTDCFCWIRVKLEVLYIDQMDCFYWIGIKLETKILDLLVSPLFSINKNIVKRPKEVSILLLDMLKQTGALLKECDIQKKERN